MAGSVWLLQAGVVRSKTTLNGPECNVEEHATVLAVLKQGLGKFSGFVVIAWDLGR
jgi:hypothetical protein